jgi:hydroxyethylthiazole kinase-like uncharacterized protein yjeF
MPEGVRVDAAALGAWPLPDAGSDKEERGRLVVVAGSRETPGAALLAVEAAFRVGAGKVHLQTVESRAGGLGVTVPELMVTGLAEDPGGSVDPAEAGRVVECADGGVVLLGPGFTDTDAAARLVGAVAAAAEGPVVLDALATAWVTGRHEEVAALDVPVVLTVNPQELACCLEVEEDEVERDLAACTARLASLTRAVVLCGGEVKVAASGRDLWRVETGNAGLGTAGSGDVQAGIVAGLLATGADPAQAAVWGAYLHGAAGDRLADRVGAVGFLARELPGELPGVRTALTTLAS